MVDHYCFFFFFCLGFHSRDVGVQNNGKISLKICIIIESNSQRTFFVIVLYTNMAAVTSSEKRELLNKGVSRITKIIITYFRRGKAFIWKRKGP